MKLEILQTAVKTATEKETQMRVYYKNQTRPFQLGKFLPTEPEYVKKGFARFLPASRYEKFQEKPDLGLSQILKLDTVYAVKQSV